MRLCLLIGLGVFCGIAPSLWADTLVMQDGRKFTGEVTAIGDSYSIKTRFGTTLIFKTYDVKQWIKGDAPQTKPATGAATTTAATRPSVDAATIEALVKQGQDALLAADYKAARDAFLDAVGLDARNVRALHGAGLAFMYLGQFPRASTYMDRAMIASMGKPDRALVLNMAMLQIGTNNSMRAVKIVKDYLESHKNEPDEAMLNALGTALFLADESAKRGTLFNTAADFYVKYQKAVEATRPGEKRWGVEWLPVAEVDKKLTEMKRKQQVVDRLGDQLDRVEERVIQAKRRLRQQQQSYARGYATQIEVNIAQQRLSDELGEFQRIARQYDDAADMVGRPVFPKVLTPVALDDLSSQGAAATATLAMADPVYKEAMTKTSPMLPKRADTEPTEEPKTTPKPVANEPPPAVVAIKSDKVQKVRVTQYAAAFAVADDLVVAPAGLLEGALEYELQLVDGSALKASLEKKDDKRGLALLRVQGRKLPWLAVGEAYVEGPLSCVCFPTVNLFNPQAELLAGSSNGMKGKEWTVKLTRHPRLPGSPLLNNGYVAGVVMANRETPHDQLPAIGADAVKAVVGNNAGQGSPAKDPTTALMQLVVIREVENR